MNVTAGAAARYMPVMMLVKYEDYASIVQHTGSDQSLLTI